jgi:diaminohydroxyphosphoribosylaminopyrimidine deaminase / 5-amino-6-(5-phosphoribosylamino)uracil reductase
MRSNHEHFMRCALQLAQKGLGAVAPNPMVGCIITHLDKIVAEGYHQRYGEAHAEVNAINQLPPNLSPSECTLYVTLEPCSHFGKTPPCADLIIKIGFKKVVVGCLDVHPLVSGNGIQKLKAAGIEVITGVLEHECRLVNKRFFTFHEKQRPYIILKWAQTADGFISRLPIPGNKADNWISSEEARTLVHSWRGQEQSILVGKNTVIADNPLLTTRLSGGKNPTRVIIDKKLELGKTYAVFNSDAPTLVINAIKEGEEAHIEFRKVEFNSDLLPQLLNVLFQKNIQSIIIEGGSTTLQHFIEQQLWDEARIFVNHDLLFGVGVKAPNFPILEEEFHSEKSFYWLYNFEIAD